MDKSKVRGGRKWNLFLPATPSVFTYKQPFIKDEWCLFIYRDRGSNKLC